MPSRKHIPSPRHLIPPDGLRQSGRHAAVNPPSSGQSVAGSYSTDLSDSTMSIFRIEKNEKKLTDSEKTAVKSTAYR